MAKRLLQLEVLVNLRTYYIIVMPGTSKAKSPSGIEIVFEELTHKYTSEVNGKLIEYTSGTTFIHKFIPEFDPTGVITERCAKKQGITVEELKK